MAKPNRIPLQVDPEFKKKLNEIQRNIMISQGKKISFREITTDIIKNPMFKHIENSMIKSENIKLNLKLKLDRRFLE